MSCLHNTTKFESSLKRFEMTKINQYQLKPGIETIILLVCFNNRTSELFVFKYQPQLLTI